MKDAWKFFLYTNIYVVVVIAAFIAVTDLLFTANLKFDYVRGFILSGTLFLYPAHRLIAAYGNPDSGIERIQYAARFKIFMWITVVISALCAGYAFLNVGLNLQFYLLPVVVLGALYSFPLIPFGRYGKLREVPYIKSFVIAAAVSYATVIPAAVEYVSRSEPLFYHAAVRFFFIAALTLPFDIRDIRADVSSRLKTLPIILGEERSKALALFLNAIFTAGNFIAWYFLDHFSFKMFVALWVSEIYASVLIKKSTSESTELYYVSGIEGAVIVQALLLFIVTLL